MWRRAGSCSLQANAPQRGGLPLTVTTGTLHVALMSPQQPSAGRSAYISCDLLHARETIAQSSRGLS